MPSASDANPNPKPQNQINREMFEADMPIYSKLSKSIQEFPYRFWKDFPSIISLKPNLSNASSQANSGQNNSSNVVKIPYLTFLANVDVFCYMEMTTDLSILYNDAIFSQKEAKEMKDDFSDTRMKTRISCGVSSALALATIGWLAKKRNLNLTDPKNLLKVYLGCFLGVGFSVASTFEYNFFNLDNKYNLRRRALNKEFRKNARIYSNDLIKQFPKFQTKKKQLHSFSEQLKRKSK